MRLLLPELIYALCAVLSVLCAVLLLRAYVRTPARILLWTSIAFTGLALNNALLFVDIVLLPQVDLSVVRTIPAFVAVAALVFGLAWELP